MTKNKEITVLSETVQVQRINRVEFDTIKKESGSNPFVMIAPIRAKRNPGSCQPLLAEEEVPGVYILKKASFCA